MTHNHNSAKCPAVFGYPHNSFKGRYYRVTGLKLDVYTVMKAIPSVSKIRSDSPTNGMGMITGIVL